MVLAWAGLHFLIVPRIGELRPWLQTQATKQLGLPVQIAAIEARSNGLIPSFTLSDVRLMDTQGRTALHLPTVTAALSVRSLLGLGFEQLLVEGLELEVRRTVDGQLWVAGLLVAGGSGSDTDAMDWLFSQPELALRHGVVRWTDEQMQAPVLALRDVDLVLRNRNRSHTVRLGATPPLALGSRLDVQGVFEAPLFSTHAQDWRQWTGQWYASLPDVDVAQWLPYAPWIPRNTQGTGSTRAWLDVRKGEVIAATADVALRGVYVQAGEKLQPLAFDNLQARLGLSKDAQEYEFFTQHLQFDTTDGLRWPGGNVRARLALRDSPQRTQGGDLSADHLDLQAMAQIAERLPLPQAVRDALRDYAPRGALVRFKGHWQGPWEAPKTFKAQGRIEQLAVLALPEGRAIPGVRGVDLDFEVQQDSGRVALDMRTGTVHLPQWLEQGVIGLEQLKGEVRWKREGEGKRLRVWSPRLQFANADAQGELRMQWNSSTRPDGMGELDLQGTLSRGQLNRVYRYLPLALPDSVRGYVRDAVLAGSASNVKFKVKGPVYDFPYASPQQGQFALSADLKDATFAYVPRSVQWADSLPWPALQRLQGTLAMDGTEMQLKVRKAGLEPPLALELVEGQATLSNLYQNATLAVQAQVRGPLSDLLGFVNASPLAGWTGGALARSTATGPAELRFQLGMGLAELSKATVAGAVTLAGNSLQIIPEAPRLTRAFGVVGFTESGFTVNRIQAQAVGGNVLAEGGLTLREGAVGLRQVRVQGTATAEGLRSASELGFVAPLARYASGSAPYQVNLSMRDGWPALEVVSALQGMEINLPAPFAKPAAGAWLLQVERNMREAPSPMKMGTGATAPPALYDQWQIELGQHARVVYQRDISGDEPRVLRGSIALGLNVDEESPLPPEGVQANMALARLDVDAWRGVLDHLVVGDPSAAAAGTSAWDAYVPNKVALRADELQISGRTLAQVVVGASREGDIWRANVHATQGDGYVEYRPSTSANAGRLYARLPRLGIGPSTAQAVENLLDQQPASIPALDIVVDDFELRGKRLGRLEIEAINRSTTSQGGPLREWRLQRFNISNPDATLTASGNWASAVPSPTQTERRRTTMAIKLDIADAGALLGRVGMPGVVRSGRGTVEGHMDWLGSPITMDYPSLSGKLQVNVESGQFLQAEPGIAKLLGVLSLQSLPRRLTLDFRDVFSDGFSFDFFRGEVDIAKGMAHTNNLQMKGVNAAVLMEGDADLARETQAIKVVVVPEINAGSASLLASVVNPLMGLSTFLAQAVLRLPLIDANTREFFIDGTWVEPRIRQVDRNTPVTSTPPKEKP